jgi:HAD superfamily hydrolase (TIGR01509 family)
LFDFDGVIVDTENVHVVAWQRTLSRMGWELTDEVASRAAEIDDRFFLRELFNGRKITEIDLEGWIKIKQDLTEMMLADAPRIYRGIVELVHGLKAHNITMAVVTTTWRKNVEIVLAAGKLRDEFALIIAKEDVLNVKPAPDGYLLALDRLGLTAAEAIAIEDSPTGLQAARSAGLPVIAVGHRRPKGAWAGDDYLANLTDTSAVLARLGISD